MIDLYTWSTPNGRKISILLEEMALPYNVIAIDIGKDAQFEDSFLNLNINNKIPVIVDKGTSPAEQVVLAESGAILVYLCEKYGSPLYSATGPSRYPTLQWLMFQMGGVGPMFGQLHHYKRYAADQAYPLDRYQKEAHRLYGVMNKRLEKNEYLNAYAYSIADIATYPWVARYSLHSVDWETFPHVKRWFDQVASRPAVQRGMNVPAAA
jgi:GST-like protein